MKPILRIISLALPCVVLLSCSKTPPESVTPIKITPDRVYIFKSTNVKTIKIEEDAGDYSLVYPKAIATFATATTGSVEIPYSEYRDAILSVRVEGSNIVIERKSMFDRNFGGVFMIKNDKGARSLFEVLCWDSDDSINGLVGPVDYTSGYLLYANSYWVNY